MNHLISSSNGYRPPFCAPGGSPSGHRSLWLVCNACACSILAKRTYFSAYFDPWLVIVPGKSSDALGRPDAA